MQPLTEYSQNALRKIRFVLTDIDDTLTENGRLPAANYQALERLQQVGLKVIPITGRPAGWCDHITRMWPVDGIVGENPLDVLHPHQWLDSVLEVWLSHLIGALQGLLDR